MRNAHPPKFSGRSQDWLQFQDEWERYLRKLASGNEIPDAQKLELLESCLDEVSQKQLRLLLKESGGGLTFNEEWSKLDLIHSKNQEFGTRKKWQEVTLFNQGKVTTREWQEFEVNFKLARQGVKDVSEGEAKRLLLQKTPPFILRWITEEEERRTMNQPTVRMNVPRNITVAGVGQSILELIGKRPTKVSKINEGEYEIVLPYISDCERLKNFNGKEFSNSNVLVQVRQVEPILTVDDIFLLVTKKLTLRDRQDLMQNSNQFPNSLLSRRSRSVGVENRKEPTTKRKQSPTPGPRRGALPKEETTPSAEQPKSDTSTSNSNCIGQRDANPIINDVQSRRIPNSKGGEWVQVPSGGKVRDSWSGWYPQGQGGSNIQQNFQNQRNNSSFMGSRMQKGEGGWNNGKGFGGRGYNSHPYGKGGERQYFQGKGAKVKGKGKGSLPFSQGKGNTVLSTSKAPPVLL